MGATMGYVVMQQYKQFALLSAVMILSVCASTETLTPTVDIIDHPILNQVNNAELGDTIVEKGRISTYEGIVLKSNVGWGDGWLLKKFTIMQGKLKALQRDKKYTYYFSDKMTAYDGLLGTSPYSGGGICIRNTDPNDIEGFVLSGYCQFSLDQKPNVQVTKIADTDTPGFRQELIYDGRSGDTVRFLYRELSSDLMRPSFSQEVQYDLKVDTMIGFKGTRIEIIEATNTHLQYRVISSFPATP